MHISSFATFAAMISFVLACAPVTESDSNGTDDGSGTSSGSTSPTTTATTNPTTTTASSSTTTTATTDMTTTDDTTSVDTSATETGTETTEDPDTSATGTESTSESGSTGEPMGDSYPACEEDADCSEPYTTCWPPMDLATPNFCTLECENPEECPIPDSGQAVPVCEGPPDTNICVLDCTDGECPTGMTCVDVFDDGQFMRCTRDA